jgi:glyoxylase-like metal-dependent hydrolase (beta-lactamase superfamily II)
LQLTNREEWRQGGTVALFYFYMIPLEDALEDMIGKAQRGLGMTDAELCAKADLLTEDLVEARNGLLREAPVRRLAGILGMHADSLIEIAKKHWHPEIPIVPGLRQFRDEGHDMTPNAYLVADANGDAVIFDTMTDATPMIEMIRKHSLRLGAICLTHTHDDHIAALPQLREAFPGVPVYSPRLEPVEGTILLDAGAEIRVSDLQIETRTTLGHTEGGMTYVVRRGLSVPVAAVGDALFAGSMGGGRYSWAEALSTNRKQLFTLAEETAVLPGHGPMTTIGQEKRHNPFYPEFKPQP